MFDGLREQAAAWLIELRAWAESLDRQIQALRESAAGGGGDDVFADVGGIEDG
jgi:hypothetical protein